MSRLIELMDDKDFLIIVSLPRHDLELAKVAYACGADALKVHINVEHKASGTTFGSWPEEKKVIESIVQAVDCPVGIMPGAQTTATEDELYDAARCGIDFLDIYDSDMPVWMLSSKMAKMVAIGPGFSLSDVQSLENLDADMLEASIIPSTQYRQPLTVKDLEMYHSIVVISELPVFVPSQKRIEPSDLVVLRDMGVQGVILGAVSIGDTLESFRERLPLYIHAIK